MRIGLKTKSKKPRQTKIVVGWREWVGLTELNADWVKAKVDTGARTSALHVTNLEIFKRRGKDFASFNIHPIQHSILPSISCRAKIIDFRRVTTSGGVTNVRPVIKSIVTLGTLQRTIEITLVNRDVMGFRMLLGRQALRSQFVVDPGRSFVTMKMPARSAKSNKKDEL